MLVLSFGDQFTEELLHHFWKDATSNKILRANGMDEWAMKLNPNGNGVSAVEFISYTNLVGRVCPPNVYISDSNKFSTGNCLYYTTDPSQLLSINGSDDITGINGWTVPKWMKGNILVCSNRGMRLPAVFETTAADTTNGSYPAGDGAPQFALAAGVPSNGGATFTASTHLGYNSDFWTWNGTTSASTGPATARAVRCVLP